MVGVYDTVMRIPRYVKSIMGAVNTAIVPHVSATGDLQVERRLDFQTASFTKYQGLVFCPLLVFLFIYSSEILHYWLGAAQVEYASYLQIALLYPLFVIIVGASSTVSVSDKDILHQLNIINGVRLIIYVFTLASLLSFADLGAFFAATLLSYLVSVALQLRTYKKFLNIRTADLIVPWLTAVASALFIFGIGRELVGLVGNPESYLCLLRFLQASWSYGLPSGLGR